MRIGLENGYTKKLSNEMIAILKLNFFRVG